MAQRKLLNQAIAGSKAKNNRNRQNTSAPNNGPAFVSTSWRPTNKQEWARIDGFINTIAPGYKEQARAKAYEILMVRGQQAAMNMLHDKFGTNGQSMNPNYKPKSSNPNPDKGGPLVFAGQKPNSTLNTSYALSKAPNPRAISLNSGIIPNTFSNDYMVPVEGACSPLHMAGVIPAVPTGATNPLSSYFTNTIVFDIQTHAQANVGFGVDITTVLSAANITAAFNAAIYALHVYFYYSSILSYESDSKNKNSGMIALRGTIDSTILSDLNQLGRRLEDTPIPPRIVEWIRWLNGNYLSSNTQGSPLIKTFFHGNNLLGANPATSFPSAALTGLVSSTNNSVFTLLRRCIPQWRVGTLYDCPTQPTFDKNFLTMFANLPTQNRSVVTTRNNSVGDNNTAVTYNTYNNNLDGLAFGMSSVWNTAAVDFIPGILQPINLYSGTYVDSRYSYYSVAGVKGFYNPYSYNLLALSRPESTIYLGTTAYTPHLTGTDKCQNVTGSALLQSAQNSLDFLFNVTSINRKGTLKSYNP